MRPIYSRLHSPFAQSQRYKSIATRSDGTAVRPVHSPSPAAVRHSIGTSAPAPDEGGATGAASEPSPGEEDALKGEAAPSPPQGHAAPDDERPPRSLTPPQAETVPASPKWPRPAPRGPPEPPSESATRQPPPYVAVQTDPLPLGPPPAYDEPGYDFPEQSFAEPTARGRRAVGTEERVGGAHGEDGQVSGTQCAGLCLTCCWLCFFLDSYVRDN